MKAKDKTGQIMQIIIYSFMMLIMAIMITLTTIVMISTDSTKGNCRMKQVDTTTLIKEKK